MFSAPFPEEEISDYIAHGPIIRVLMVVLAGVCIIHGIALAYRELLLYAYKLSKVLTFYLYEELLFCIYTD